MKTKKGPTVHSHPLLSTVHCSRSSPRPHSKPEYEKVTSSSHNAGICCSSFSALSLPPSPHLSQKRELLYTTPSSHLAPAPSTLRSALHRLDRLLACSPALPSGPTCLPFSSPRSTAASQRPTIRCSSRGAPGDDLPLVAVLRTAPSYTAPHPTALIKRQGDEPLLSLLLHPPSSLSSSIHPPSLLPRPLSPCLLSPLLRPRPLARRGRSRVRRPSSSTSAVSRWSFKGLSIRGGLARLGGAMTLAGGCCVDFCGEGTVGEEEGRAGRRREEMVRIG